MKLTPSQSDAVEKEGTNIIVSAGAGSGKTAVLTQRVLRKLQDGVDIRKILVLTFTNEAAGEMKNRIRKEIKKNNLKEALEYLDTAYITTFDAYALSIVKKYHYLLNISPEVKIIDTSIINLEKKKILDDLFNEFYAKKDEDFLNLINDFTVRDDTEIKKVILNIKNGLDLRIDKEEYLNNYLTNFYNEEYFNKLIAEYFNYLKNLCLDLENKIMLFGDLVDSEKYQKVYNTYSKVFNPQKYDNLAKVDFKISLRGLEDDEKKLYQEIKDLGNNIKDLCSYNYDELKESYFSTKKYTSSIINIITNLDKRLTNYKYQNNAFEFNDIAKMAIKIVKDNQNIKEELKNYFNEILIDEYQDTSDLQEEFIQNISNNNVYMVGDIKQSIYRFRNANPNIFKNKYDLYKDNKGGIVIDLLENFRSRKEVLEDINTIFNLVMTDSIGGINYQDRQAMIFGNNAYEEEGKTEENNHLDILKYTEDKTYSNSEIEAFIIAKDILNKINNNYEIYDFDLKKLRKVIYSDFCLILDRGRDMPLYKRIFEYFNIPLEINDDTDLTMEQDMIILKNILGFIIKVANKEYDQEFKYNFVSIARSFLKEYTDNEILDIITNNKIFKTDIYTTCKELTNNIGLKTPSIIIEEIINKFNFYEKLIKVGDINNSIERIDYILNLASNAEDLGLTIKDFKDYLEEMITSDDTIKYKVGKSTLNCVKIMNIHKSKGLQFPICYYAGLKNKFNFKDLTKRFIYDKNYGIITPYFKEGIGTLFVKELVKNNYYKEEISEKIRLLYVALTRSKEKIIIVIPEFNKEGLINNQVDLNIGLNYRSFYDIFTSISLNLSKYTKIINLEDLELTHDYQKINLRNPELSKDNNKIKFQELNTLKEIIDNSHASKTIKELIDLKQAQTLAYGTSIHEMLELTNLKDLNINNKYVNNLQNTFDLITPNIYQELEFIFKEENIEYHGIIDLMLEYPDEIKIIDYKLKNINDKEYTKQLNVYYNYVKSISNKKINLYLYSILDNNLKEVPIIVKDKVSS